MADEREDGGPAFPEAVAADLDGGLNFSRNPGLSMRDYFAGQAMGAMCGTGTWPHGDDGPEIAKRSYAVADAMLKARVIEVKTEKVERA